MSLLASNPPEMTGITGPLQVALMRYRELPVRIGDEPGQKAWVLMIIDHFDGGFLGIRVEPHEPTELSLIRCFDFAIAPKHPGKRRFPGCRGPWHRSGVPAVLAIDDPLQKVGQRFADRCQEKGADLMIQRPMQSEELLFSALHRALPKIASFEPGEEIPTMRDSFLNSFVMEIVVDGIKLRR